VSSNLSQLPNNSEFLLYTTEDGEKQIHVKLVDETVWLPQNLMAELFDTSKQNVSLHIKNIFEEGELVEDSVVKEYLTTALDGKNYKTKFYNLDVIISVGYRIKSLRGTQFRQWATQRLREYIVKGYTIDKKRLKEPGGIDYFDKLLEDIREIRASEKRFYLKIRDIYTTSVDYDPKSDTTRQFFQIVQNKMLWAITGQTAAEIIHSRANAVKPNMGLTSWEKKKIGKTDITIAKNYLEKEEIDQLDRIVSMYLDFAELQAMNRVEMTMAKWVNKLDGFLSLNDRDILTHAGKMSKELADRKAKSEYEIFDKNRKEIELLQAEEEFEREVKMITQINPAKVEGCKDEV